MNPGKRTFAALLCMCAMASSPALADIYGFVDDHGVVHLSNTPLDERYFLFRKQAQRVAPPENAGTTEDIPVQGARPTAMSGELQGAAASRTIAPLIAQVSKEHDVDAALIYAVVAAESNFNANAQSPKGARGLMQLMPATAARFGVKDVWSPLENLRAGTRYLRHLLGMFQDNVSLALAAYNAGEGAVIAAGYAIPPYAETKNYVPKVLRLWEGARAAASQ